jgi:HEAT repeat protein
MRAFTGGMAILLAAVGLVMAGGAPTREDIPKYIKTLTSTSAKSGDRVTAANMIGKRGSIKAKDVEDAIDPLRKVASKDKDGAVRKAALSALGNIGPDDNETIPLLINILKTDPSKDIKFASINALAQFGTRAKSAMPAINEFAKTLDKKEKRMLKDVNKAIQGN